MDIDSQTQHNAKVTRTRKPEKPPIIIAKKTTIKNLITPFETAKRPEDSYILRTACEEFTDINFETDYKETKIALTEGNIEYFNHPTKSERLKTRIIKGLTGGFNATEVQEARTSANITNVEIIKVIKMERKFKPKDPHFYIDQVSRDSIFTNLTRTILILSQKIC